MHDAVIFSYKPDILTLNIPTGSEFNFLVILTQDVYFLLEI